MTKDEALKLALEALKKIATVNAMDYEYQAWAREALAQPAVTESHKQEPVAWRNAAIRVGEDLCSVGPFGYYDMTAEQWLDWALSVVTVHAPPPQRTWVGLTEAQCGVLWKTNMTPFEYYQAIEAALRSKNDR